MINQPAADDLLATARRLLLDSILPGLAADKTYDALMIANAMAIAMRELKSGPVDPCDEQITRFLEDHDLPPARPHESPETHLAALIRHKRIPAALQHSLLRLLMDMVRHKLAVSNPKYMNAA
jgi:hypothetical protein